MTDIDTTKAGGIDRLPATFLKDGAYFLSKPVTDICNLSIFLNKFPSASRLAKVKPIFKKGRKIMFQITDKSLTTITFDK